MRITSRGFPLLALAIAIGSVGAEAQQPPTSEPPRWTGWARCQVNVLGPGYTDQQTHTWTLAGGTPTVEGAFRIYAGTWSVVGGGSLTRTQGTQTLVAQWATNVQGMNGPIAVFIRASDGRMLISARHPQLRARGAIAGYQQLSIDGKPQAPGRISLEAFEWPFPVANGPSTSTSLGGSSTPAVNGSVGLMRPAGSRGTASCTWQFGRGSAAPAPPATLTAQAIPTPAAPGVATAQPSGQPAGGAASGGSPTGRAAAGGAASGGAAGRSAAAGSAAEVLLPAAMGTSTVAGSSLVTCGLDAQKPIIGPMLVTPGGVRLAWEPVNPGRFPANGTLVGTVVSRSDLGVLTPQPIVDVWGKISGFFHQIPLDYRTGITYSYTITTQFSQGGCSSVQIPVTPPKPATPIVYDEPQRTNGGPINFIIGMPLFLATQTGFLITGPGMPAQGLEKVNTSHAGFVPWEGFSANVQLTGLAAGTYTWLITAYWDTPTGRMIDVSTGVSFTKKVQ